MYPHFLGFTPGQPEIAYAPKRQPNPDNTSAYEVEVFNTVYTATSSDIGATSNGSFGLTRKSVPHHDGKYLIHNVSRNRVFTCHDGHLRLEPTNVKERNGFRGFKNIAEGAFLGHDFWWDFCAKVYFEKLPMSYVQAPKQRAKEEQQRAEEAEEQTRLTTLDEYIAACHDSVFSRFAIETDPKLTSKGPLTNPRNKWCPKNLRPWPNFLHQQKVTFGTLHHSFPTESRLFENRNFLGGMGNRVSQRPIGDEKTLEYFLHNSVEVEEVGRDFQIGDGVVFENHPHALSDVAEEVVERETPSTPPRTPDHGIDLNQLRPDQICVYRSDNTPSSQRTMVYVSEYKPPHKLTAPHLRVGLRPMDIYREVVNRRTIPTSINPDARFQYHAEKLTASAITQTYHYMIESGLGYGLLTTGEAIVFLNIDWDDPETLYYHLAEPGPEVSAHPNNLHICTAVGQYLAFTLMALGAPGERREISQEERQKAMNGLKRWSEDFESTFRSIPENERSVSSAYSPGHEPTTYKDVDRSPALPRRRTRRTAKCQIGEGSLRKDGKPEPSDDESASRPPDTPTPTGRNARQGTRRSRRLALRPPRGDGEQGRQYCTQKCLLGMVKVLNVEDIGTIT
ncbi:hypothetical protein FPOAC2_10258 [Fusarium poae]